MKTAVNPCLKAKTYCIKKSHTRLVEKEINLINLKLYQKLFGSFLADLELVKTVQPNFLIVFAKKLPLNPQPKIKNFLSFLLHFRHF